MSTAGRERLGEALTGEWMWPGAVVRQKRQSLLRLVPARVALAMKYLVRIGFIDEKRRGYCSERCNTPYIYLTKSSFDLGFIRNHRLRQDTPPPALSCLTSLGPGPVADALVGCIIGISRPSTPTVQRTRVLRGEFDGENVGGRVVVSSGEGAERVSTDSASMSTRPAIARCKASDTLAVDALTVKQRRRLCPAPSDARRAISD